MDIGPIWLGTANFGSGVGEDVAREMVHSALEMGVQRFDTSNNYSDGQSERILGNSLKGCRSEVKIATKCGKRSLSQGPVREGLSEASVRRAVEGSLSRLQTDYIDLLYLHAPDPSTPIHETLHVVDELIQEGTVRFLGLSNFAAWQIVDAFHVSVQYQLHRPVVAQCLYNLLARRMEDEYAECAKEVEVGTAVYNPLAGGLLTGKFRNSPEPTIGSRLNHPVYQSRYWNPDQLWAVEELSDCASECGWELLELSLRWLYSRDIVDAIVIGASSVEQLSANLAIDSDSSSIPADLESRINDVWQRLHGVAPSYREGR